MRAAAQAGHETGVHTWDHILWQDYVARKDAAWTERQMLLATERYIEVFKASPAVHGAAGWQMNDAALELLGRLGYRVASDTRGRSPFVPVVHGRECVLQCPTTLPTLDELIGRDGITADNVHEMLLKQSADGRDHVFTLHAELEGGQLAPVMERLLAGWRGAGLRTSALADYAAQLDTARLPRAPVLRGTVEGRSGELAVQG
jgi:peptidoglycan/xylan/chitin deacetylase (PgdA/CDA1 family)